MSSPSPARSGTRTTPRSCSLPDRSTSARPGTVTLVRRPFSLLHLVENGRERDTNATSFRSPFRRRLLDELCRHLARAPDCDAGRPEHDELFVALSLSSPTTFGPLPDFADRILSALAKTDASVVTGGVLLISWFWFFAGGRKLCAAIFRTSRMRHRTLRADSRFFRDVFFCAERRYRGPRNVLAEEKQIHTVQKGDDLVEGKRDDDDSFGQ